MVDLVIPPPSLLLGYFVSSCPPSWSIGTSYSSAKRPSWIAGTSPPILRSRNI
ncbi:hypothetical protein BDP81DRAFT_428961 [Colletotrichum phormii]|uniref:Uncharacterized protein n=1 Tax=Colletotrichum phormii TaxID=359342 RepID=A0AAI9ZQ63_9PEZI|nr:uncharacterized protein BDP81DRAFT_428961 [Colletotrichum phormii]KAK1636058.1 hypothetical protein BDP81DRAFT_428961 [Colletotrichum phormii]